MVAQDHVVGVVGRWYQRAWLWGVVGIAFFLVALGVAVFAADDYETPGSSPVVMTAFAVFAIPVLAVFMAALVSQRPRARGALLALTAVFLFLGAYGGWGYNAYLESETLDGCLPILTPDGEEALLDAELCEASEDGTLQSWQRTTRLVFALFWVAPVAALLFLGKRLRPQGVTTSNTSLQAVGAGWVLLAIGVYMAAISYLDDSFADALLWWVLPGVLGVLLIAWGRSRGSGQKSHPPRT